jgi:sirohydrochlorin cobaltochelatase
LEDVKKRLTTMSEQAIILFAHGSRDPLWHRPIEAVANKVRELSPQQLVSCAFLEISTPNLAQASEALIAQGTQHIKIVPLFFGVGRHAREDLPAQLEVLKQRFPQVRFTCQAAVGEREVVIELLAQVALL